MGDTPDTSARLSILVKFPESQWPVAHRGSSTEAADKLLHLALPAMRKGTVLDGTFWSSERTKFILGHSPLVCFPREYKPSTSFEWDPEGMHSSSSAGWQLLWLKKENRTIF